MDNMDPQWLQWAKRLQAIAQNGLNFNSESVVREVFEESGFKTRAVRLLAVYDRGKHPHQPRFPFHVYKFFYLCEIIGGAARRSVETSAAGFFGRDELPELSLARITPGQLRRMFELAERPNAPTDYD